MPNPSITTDSLPAGGVTYTVPNATYSVRGTAVGPFDATAALYRVQVQPDPNVWFGASRVVVLTDTGGRQLVLRLGTALAAAVIDVDSLSATGTLVARASATGVTDDVLRTLTHVEFGRVAGTGGAGDRILVRYSTDGGTTYGGDGLDFADAAFAWADVRRQLGVDGTPYGAYPVSATFVSVGSGATITGVTVSPSTATVAGGATQQFTATVTGSGSPSQTVTWTATAGTITSAGLFTAPAATSSAQTVTVTATASNGTTTGTATVTVPAANTATSISISPRTGPTLAQGALYDFSVTVTGTGNPGGFTVSVTGGTYTLLNANTIRFQKDGATSYAITVTSSLNPSLTDTASGTLQGAAPAPVLRVRDGITPLTSGATLPNAGRMAGTAPLTRYLTIDSSTTTELAAVAVAWVGTAPAWATAALDVTAGAPVLALTLTSPAAVPSPPDPDATLRVTADGQLFDLVVPGAVAANTVAAQLAAIVSDQAVMRQVLAFVVGNATTTAEVGALVSAQVAATPTTLATGAVNAVASASKMAVEGGTLAGVASDAAAARVSAGSAASAATAVGSLLTTPRAELRTVPALTAASPLDQLQHVFQERRGDTVTDDASRTVRTSDGAPYATRAIAVGTDGLTETVG